MMEVFPAPVGPVIAKISRPVKSITARCLKLVKPSNSRLNGRIERLLVEFPEQGRHLVRWRTGSLVHVESSEKIVRIGSGDLHRLGFLSRIIQPNLQRVREYVANRIGCARRGLIYLDRDSQQIVSKTFRGGL